MSLPPSVIVHGVFMSIAGTGVLLRGESGIGKSDLALGLIDRGHQLIADDAVEFSSPDGCTLVGKSPHLLRHFLEIRDLGVLDIGAHFGAQAVLEKQTLSLVVTLQKSPPSHEIYLKNLPYSLLNIAVDAFSLSLTEGRPREVLLETLVRHYQFKQAGIDTTMQFIENHNQALRASS